MRLLRKGRFGRISSHLSKISLGILILEFLIAYITMGILFALAYWVCCDLYPESLFTFNRGDLCLPQAFYFSFITQLTVGYGDLAPLGYAQPLAITQGILGVILVGIWAGVVVAKWFTAGSRESILFADWAGYSLKDQNFFVLFVNRRVDDLFNANINVIIKLAGHNPVRPSVAPPYIGRSVWPFKLSDVPLPLEALAELQLEAKDGIKICISGTAGMTRCTNWKKYSLDELYVVSSLEYYEKDEFEEPRFDRDFFKEFNSPQAGGAKPFFYFLRDEARRRQNPERRD